MLLIIWIIAIGEQQIIYPLSSGSPHHVESEIDKTHILYPFGVYEKWYSIYNTSSVIHFRLCMLHVEYIIANTLVNYLIKVMNIE